MSITTIPLNESAYKEEFNKREEIIRQGVLKDMLFDNLYGCLEEYNNEGFIRFNKYNINEANILYILEKYDKRRFEETENMLLKDCKKKK